MEHWLTDLEAFLDEAFCWSCGQGLPENWLIAKCPQGHQVRCRRCNRVFLIRGANWERPNDFEPLVLQ